MINFLFMNHSNLIINYHLFLNLELLLLWRYAAIYYSSFAYPYFYRSLLNSLSEMYSRAYPKLCKAFYIITYSSLIDSGLNISYIGSLFCIPFLIASILLRRIGLFVSIFYNSCIIYLSSYVCSYVPYKSPGKYTKLGI